MPRFGKSSANVRSWREADFRDNSLFVRLGTGRTYRPKFSSTEYSIFQNTGLLFSFSREAKREPMEQIPEPRRRLNILTRAERRRRIFARLREGWAYDEIAREERVSPERIRQIVAEVLAKRVVDRGADHAHLQLERLMPALRLVGEAIGRGELKAVGPLIKVIDRLDKHQDTVVAKHSYGPEERQRLLDKINRVAANLAAASDEPAAPAAGAACENIFAEIPS